MVVVYSKTQEDGGLGLKTSACPQRRTPESITVCSRVMYVICTLLGTHPTPELWSVPAPCEYQDKERLGINTICVLGLICRAAVPKEKESREERSSSEPDLSLQLKARLVLGRVLVFLNKCI